MVIKTLTRGQSQEAMKEWITNYPNLPDMDDDFKQLRIDLQSINTTIRNEIDNSNIKRTDYYLDYNFGLRLYEYLLNQPGFSLRVAANDGFWRFLSVIRCPYKLLRIRLSPFRKRFFNCKSIRTFSYFLPT